MLIVMKKKATEEDLKGVKRYLIERDFDFHQSTGADRVILGVIGNTADHRQERAAKPSRCSGDLQDTRGGVTNALRGGKLFLEEPSV